MLKQVTVATQTGHESPDLAFNPEKMTTDRHCYECKVRYKDPKPQDLVMYLHAWKYKVSLERKKERIEKTVTYVHAEISRHNKALEFQSDARKFPNNTRLCARKLHEEAF